MKHNKIHLAGEGIADDELHALVHLIKKVHGFDFGGYTVASFKRRITRIMDLQKLSYFELTNRLINEEGYFDHFLDEVTVNITEMFRDPPFFKAIKEKIIPYLKSYQQLKIWSAGCASGEELYSIAILFSQADLYSRSFFYGTDVNQEVLMQAKDGIYDLQKMKQYSENYMETDSDASLSNYYTAQYDAASIDRKLKKNMLLSVHNLVSDGPFNEFQLITCRNVLIYFNAELQARVIKLFYDSLVNFGFLCLGSKETIRNFELAKKFKLIDKKNNIYQKIN
jgi:chemotaxis protein methyltransferase CheR